MEESVRSYSSISITKVCVQMEEDFKYHLPLWNEASFLQRVHISFLYLIICLPVFILLLVTIGGYAVYLTYYIYYLVADTEDRPELYYWHSDEEKRSSKIRGIIFFTIETFTVLMVIINHFKAMFTDPGFIPDTQTWNIPSHENSEVSDDDSKLAERSKKGLIRSCNHCKKRKPDRTHHCRQCNRCNLKMDHHCNWIANCVGYYNYKFFFLIVFYGALGLTLFSATFWECVVVVLNDPKNNTVSCLFVVMCYSLISLLAVAVDCFLVFHLWMIYNNYTTIEFCEKKRKEVPGYESSPFKQDKCIENFKQGLGDNPWLWLLPVNDRAEGTGLYYR